MTSSVNDPRRKGFKLSYAERAIKLTFSRPCSSIESVANRIGQILLIAAALAPFHTGCGKPFDVKTEVDLPAGGNSAERGGLKIRALPITDEDWIYNTFDANLIMAGLLPIEIEIYNSNSAAARIERAKFELKTEDGKKLKPLDPRRAFKRLISYYEINAYNKRGYRQSLEDFLSYALDLRRPLGPNQSRRGLLFFAAPPETARKGQLALSIELPDQGSRLQIELRGPQ